MRSARAFLAALAVLAALLAVALSRGGSGAAAPHGEIRVLVAALGLTDLAVWSEARYTRHPTQADFFAPFQDAPGAPEHFPAGSVISPPAGLRSAGGPILTRPAGAGTARP